MRFLTVILLSWAVLASSDLLDKRNAAPINMAAVELIKDVEQFRANFYLIGGHKTIGYGHDCPAQRDCDTIHPPISQAEGLRILYHDLPQFEKCVCAMPGADGLNANQYGALVSFAFNSGCGGVHKFFNAYLAIKTYDLICIDLPSTNLGKNNIFLSRRGKEAAFCSLPTTDLSGCKPQPATNSTSTRTSTSTSASKTSFTKTKTTKTKTTKTKTTKTKTTKTHTTKTHTTKTRTTKTRTMGALETKVLRTDEIDKYIMRLLAA